MTVRENKYILNEDKDFFILLKAGLWQTSNEELSNNPDWEYIYRIACEQAVLGIITDGIKVKNIGNALSKEWHLRCVTDSATIVKRNIEIENLQARLCKILDNNNIIYVILKGQAVAECYPNPRFRSSGDIDILLQPDDFEKAIELMRPLATDVMSTNRENNKFGFNVKDVPVELHTNLFQSQDSLSVYLRKKLAEMFESKKYYVQEIGGYKIKVPNPEFHFVFLFYHILMHLFTLGIGIRQFCDFAIYYHKHNDSISIPDVRTNLNKQLNLKLWSLIYSFAVNFLGMDDNLGMHFTKTSDNRVAKIWDVCKESGNFGIKYNYGNEKHLIKRKLAFAKTEWRFFTTHWKVSPAMAIIKTKIRLGHYTQVYINKISKMIKH